MGDEWNHSRWGPKSRITKTCLFKYTEKINNPQKNENFLIKNSDMFHISTHNIDIGYSNDYPQSMFLSRNKENNVYPVKPSFII